MSPRPRWLAVFVLASLLLSIAVVDAQAQDDRTLPAVIEKDTVLSGEYRMTRDLVVAPGATLRIKSGTTIVVSARDASNGGYRSDLCELRVSGTLQVVGTEAAPVFFRGEGSSALRGTWFGIVLDNLRETKPDSGFRHLRLSGAWAGVQVSRGSPRFEHCVFQDCDVGVGVGYTHVDSQRWVQAPEEPEPELSGCLFVRCDTGLFAEAVVSPLVERCLFLECGTALGNTRKGLTYSLFKPGPRVDRCLFSRNTVAVDGTSVVQNSIFLANGTVISLSKFHRVYATQTDWLAWRGNVFHDNTALSADESDFGVDQLHVDPVLQNLPVIGGIADWKLPLTELALAPDSPARGRALDGGDPGPTGRSGATGHRFWTLARHALRRVLVLGPPGAVQDATKGGLRGTTVPEPGDSIGGAWWSVFELDQDGTLAAESLFWLEGVPICVGFAFVPPSAAAECLVELNVDGRVQATLQGKTEKLPDLAFRFGREGQSFPAPSSGQRTNLVVEWNVVDPAARIGVAVLDPEGRAVPAHQFASAPASTIEVVPLRFRDARVGFQIRSPFHWADLTREGVLTVVDGAGSHYPLVDLDMQVGNRPGKVEVTPPAGFVKTGATLLIRGLRTPDGGVWPNPSAPIAIE